MNEEERIIETYRKRDLNQQSSYYSFFKKDYLFWIQERTRYLLDGLKKNKMINLSELKILDIGCGNGSNLQNLIQLGANPNNLYGIDLVEERIAQAKSINPYVNLICGGADKLPWLNNHFDIVLQFTCFTSILNNTLKKNIAKEMLRVLKDDGLIIWYDFKYDNPKNKNVRGIKKAEIKNLFPNCHHNFKSITLAPPIMRKLAPLSCILTSLLSNIKILNTHYFATIRKK